MTVPSKPRVRSLELMPFGETRDRMYALRDPRGLAGTVALPHEAAILVTLMNGERTLGELRQEFEQKVGKSLTLPDVEKVVQQLDEQYFLDNDRFAEHEAKVIAEYQSLDIRPAAHAGSAYPADVEGLHEHLAELFTCEQGPGLLPWEGSSKSDFATNGDRRLCGVMSPHIDLRRGGPTFAWSYDRIVAESDAELFIILGTAHTQLDGLFSVSRKHFETPLGTVTNDRTFTESLERRLGSQDSSMIFDHEFPHRTEHSIEFQTLLLQYVLGKKRDFSIVPILVGSFFPFVERNHSPGDSLEVSKFIAALRDTAENCRKKVCFIAGVDLAHIGQQFGDDLLLDDARLTEQWTDDQQLLSTACEGDPEAWFIHVAAQGDRNRICGLAPTYTMLETMRPGRGELLRYDQAVAEDRTSCVSFASVAFYE